MGEAGYATTLASVKAKLSNMKLIGYFLVMRWQHCWIALQWLPSTLDGVAYKGKKIDIAD